MLLRFNILVILFLLLSACASGPSFDSRGVDRSLTPRSVAAGSQMATGKQVLWGGTILHTTNLKDSTQMDVLSSSRPVTWNPPAMPKAG
jgi:outer membrane lipoprotein